MPKKTESTNPVGSQFQNLLKKKGVSLAELSRILKLPVLTIRRVIFGKTLDPRLSTVKKIASYFDMSLTLLKDSVIENQSVVPLFDWNALEHIDFNTPFHKEAIDYWQAVPPMQEALSAHSFATIIHEGIYPRFPKDSVLIFDTKLSPEIGDIVLVKIDKDIFIKEWGFKNKTAILKDLSENTTRPFTEEQLIAVNVVALFYRSKKRRK